MDDRTVVPARTHPLLSDTAVLAYLALFKLLLHVLTTGLYGFHRDEFLYIAMGHHLDWGYVEIPPTIGVAAWLGRVVLGGALLSYRLFPAAMGAGIVFLSGLMAREMGGRRFAQVLTAVAMIVAPAYLRSHSLFQPVTFDQFYWALAAYLFIRLLREGRPERWLAFGAVIGLGLMAKYTMLLFGLGVFAGLVLTAYRKRLLTPWPWLAAGIAFIIFLPNLIWQHLHGWVFFEFVGELSRQQFVNVDPAGFMIAQALMCMMATPIWLAGLYHLFSKEGRPFRPLAWMYLTPLLVLLLARGKAYYLLPAYPMLIAAGAGVIERAAVRVRRTWLKPVIVGLVVAVSIPTIPYGLPVVPIEAFKQYVRFMADNFALEGPLTWETGEIHAIPQDFADMFGWEEQVAAVAGVYSDLSPEEKEKCVIFATNYGEAGAINYFGGKYGLPGAINFNGSFYTWGPGGRPGEVLLAVGLPGEALTRWYDDVELAATITHDIARERSVSVFVCRGPNATLQEVWPRFLEYRF